MSELDQDGAKSLADNEDTDSIETTIEDNDVVEFHWNSQEILQKTFIFN